ncbi:MAG TPA: DNA polymerase ligase N-terminal domain-containing protein [Chitinophagaceae bacterium]|jgi:bifunctional non-homologous end joining protein LigD|nr:DNA polymerase ligase N-terminal domain-containing protein [Chitinophagaceae bacterium]
MSLSLYKKKRSFDETPEPEAKKKSSKRGLKFVVQKHDASHLHYDFRLEMEGVLKSWAVPKGPSLNPEDKRLAMMVEDHPYDYRTFEGTIPEGNYGAGTVMVWDEGTYEAMAHEDEPIKKQEKILLEELKKGDLKIVLHGEKLKGAFALVKMRGRGENTWLLIKKDDDAATKRDITKKDKSVKTGRSLNQIAEETGGKKKEKKSLTKKTPKAQLLNTGTNNRVKKKLTI